MNISLGETWEAKEIKDRFGAHFESEIEVLSEFPVMYSGWECDEKGWVINVQRTNQVKVVLTNHGSFYLSTEEELKSMIKGYEETTKLTKDALLQLQMRG
jgi:hypothetical protein